MINKIKHKVHNIEIVVEEIKQVPQTYKSILKEQFADGTCQTILRRKLNNLCKQGIVCKTSIPGTRFGKAIFYVLPKKYYILVEATRLGSAVYYFFDFRKISKFYIEVDNLYKLEKDIWIKNKEKRFFEGNVLKFI